jgi:hypothetical protein
MAPAVDAAGCHGVEFLPALEMKRGRIGDSDAANIPIRRAAERRAMDADHFSSRVFARVIHSADHGTIQAIGGYLLHEFGFLGLVGLAVKWSLSAAGGNAADRDDGCHANGLYTHAGSKRDDPHGSTASV